MAYVDACYETAQGEMAQYLKSGLFYPLNKWLHSGEGQVVYRLYDKEVWKGSSVDGENYVLPEHCDKFPASHRFCPPLIFSP